ncbi:MAG: anti-sigma factor [Hyphomonas sp.]|uniref:ChrR family anti-sigma-E factor n=1 Tax=Hyphomonas sp. TaxID=87 RepID=UPI00181714BA|nr:ChrR family anti-sigma-E factor [Hyphomonas sp.]MBU3921461.1 ChrR family anti-sigma-E factor [Alphaproteobacteria bacterium]MBA3070399.1 anti-sigma factor [Hyphomonas sp.]MBU4062886.1 ChrR family anti-sigma-E factor [Alphaproteobacteria bacterium]MBU4163805.1 ChrR family anti-sigma-E factor [Alphaproteobacteria bacterium]MBU4569264.1 ChrR family anti-sigma-E factor [Alphaproteobacteria bacterium]
MTETPTNLFSELYAAYAAGCLDPAFALMVETQSALRPGIRQSVAVSEMIAGAVLETAPAAPLSEGALDRALAAIDALDTGAEASVAAGRAAGEATQEVLALPEPLRGAALEAIGRAGWKRMGRGLKRLSLLSDAGLETELYRISPGARIPHHTHAGTEYTLVVAGGFSDERGSYGPGEVMINGPDDLHQPVGDEGEVCYALAVRDGGLRFTGMLGLLQRLTGA